MEIFEFLHLTTRRLFAMVVVTLLAGAATAAVLVNDSTDSYEAEAVVFLGQVLPADRSTFAVAPFAGDLEVLLSLDPTLDDVAAASGVDRIPTLGLTTRQISNGTAVGIRAVASTPELAETIASEAARVGLSTLLQQERNRAQRTLEAVNRQLLQVRADLEQFRDANVTQDTNFEIGTAVEERTAIQEQLLNPNLTAAAQDTLESRRQELNDEIDRLVPLQAAYNELDRELLGVEAALSGAKQEIAAADALIVSSASGDFVVTTPATAVSNQSTLRAGVVASMIVAILLSIGFFVLIDRRRSNKQGGDSPEIEPPGQRLDRPSSTSEQPESEQDVRSTDVADDTTEDSSADDGSADAPPDAAAPADTSALTCVCGRVCLTASGLSSHQRACKTYDESLSTDHPEPLSADQESSVDDGDDDDAAEPAFPFQAPTGSPLRVLISDFGAPDDSEQRSHGVLKEALEDAGLDEGKSYKIVNAISDSDSQIRQAEEAIDDGVSIILLIGCDPETSATIASMAAESGVEIVEYSDLGAGLAALGAADTNDTETEDDAADGQSTNDDEHNAADEQSTVEAVKG